MCTKYIIVITIVILLLQLFPNEEPTIVKKLCLTHRLSEYIRISGDQSRIYLTGRALNLFNEVQTKLYHSPPVNRNGSIAKLYSS